MKGPGLRLLVDVRRTWRCPRCGYEEHVGAQVTTVACPCCPGVAMKLNEQTRYYADELAKLRSRPKPEPVEGEFDVAQVIESQSESAVAVEPPVTELTQSTAGDSLQIPKRRGARPHKQSRRGQHKQQQQHHPDTPTCENNSETEGRPVNQTPPESPDDPAPADT
jgi:hypothetical protein